MNRHARRAAAATDKGPSAAIVLTLGGRDYEIGRFNIGELKRMTEIVERSDHALDRSKLVHHDACRLARIGVLGFFE